jgi:predicted secreted protein
MIGRKVAFTWNGAAIDGVREKGITINGEPVEYTSDEDDGVPTFDSEVGELSWEISLDGILKEDTLLTAAATKTDRIKAVTITYPDGGVISGDFLLASYTEGQPYKEGVTFTATLRGDGAITYTPG